MTCILWAVQNFLFLLLSSVTQESQWCIFFEIIFFLNIYFIVFQNLFLISFDVTIYPCIGVIKNKIRFLKTLFYKYSMLIFNITPNFTTVIHVVPNNFPIVPLIWRELDIENSLLLLYFIDTREFILKNYYCFYFLFNICQH